MCVLALEDFSSSSELVPHSSFSSFLVLPSGHSRSSSQHYYTTFVSLTSLSSYFPHPRILLRSFQLILSLFWSGVCTHPHPAHAPSNPRHYFPSPAPPSRNTHVYVYILYIYMRTRVNFRGVNCAVGISVANYSFIPYAAGVYPTKFIILLGFLAFRWLSLFYFPTRIPTTFFFLPQCVNTLMWMRV